MNAFFDKDQARKIHMKELGKMIDRMEPCMIALVEKRHGNYCIRVYDMKTDTKYDGRMYLGYTKSEALRRYRQAFGLVGKHMEVFDFTNGMTRKQRETV